MSLGFGGMEGMGETTAGVGLEELGMQKSREWVARKLSLGVYSQSWDMGGEGEGDWRILRGGFMTRFHRDGAEQHLSGRRWN